MLQTLQTFTLSYFAWPPRKAGKPIPLGDMPIVNFSRDIYLQWQKYYRSVILAAKRKQEGSHWSKITRAFLRREYCFNSLETLRKPRRRRKRGHGETKDLIGRTIAQHVRSMQNNNVKSPQFASSANRNRDGKLF